MYKLSKEMKDALINYLASRPFGEVFKLIMELDKLEEIKEESGDL